MVTTQVKQTQCACPSCSCTVELSDAIVKDGKYYCCDNCAEGHVNGGSCVSSDCGCH